MKKTILYFLGLIILGTKVQAQLPNPSFENWNSISYGDPDPWLTANRQSVNFAGIAVVTQVAGFSGSAVHMETTLSGSDTLGAFISNTPGDPILGEGGIPYSAQPVAISGYFRYNILANDTALLVVVFKQNGVILSNDLFKITGTQNTFSFFNFPLTLASMPDTVIIASASSNLASNVGVMPGSFLELDELSFVGGVVTPPIPGGTFDTWNTFIHETLIGWNSLTNGTSKTTDSYAGSFALRLETKDEGNGNISPGAVSTGTNSSNFLVGGLPYTLMADTLTGYYKYTPSASDTAVIGVTLSLNGQPVGGGGKFFMPASVYTYFEFPFSGFTAPDTLRIDIFSSNFPVQQTAAGSVFLLDNLRLKSQTGVGIFEYGNTGAQVVAYPNPSTNMIVFYPNRKIQGEVTLALYDVSGRKVREEMYKNVTDNLHLNISVLNIGVYHYQITGNNFHAQGKFVKD